MQKDFPLLIQQDSSGPNSFLPPVSTYLDLAGMAFPHCLKSQLPKINTFVYLGMYAR